MIGANQYNLTWDHFDELHSDRRTAFENLCRSLFQREFCDEGTILHSDPNHPGVEVEPVFSNKEDCMISFQSKYFDGAIGTSGYSQIKSSADQAIKHYQGCLEKIILFCNKDITATSTSYKNTSEVLLNAGISVTIVSNQSILEMAAGYPAVLSTYFGLDSLNRNWFDENLRLSLDNLGKRYNPNFNIDTEAQKKLSIFLREKTGIDLINEKKRDLLKELDDYRWRNYYSFGRILTSLKEKLSLIPDISESTIFDALNWEEQYAQLCKEEFSELKELLDNENKRIQDLPYTDREYESVRNKIFVIERLLSLPGIIAISPIEKNCINSRFMLVKGEMGTGKTQLLATSAKRLMQDGHLTVLILGQTLITSESIDLQIMNGFAKISPNQSLESFLNVLEENANQTQKDSVVFIDAINESRDHDVWKQGINKIVELFAGFPNIRLVVSLRKGFEKLVLSEKVLSDIESEDVAVITHCGLADESPYAVFDFLSHYGVPFSPEYYLQTEMTNPLFLMWFCQTYSGEESELYSLIDKVLKQADAEASKAIGSSDSVGIIESIIDDIFEYKETSGKALTKETLLGLPSWNRYGITNRIAYINAIERFGLLASFARDDSEFYYFGYNLLEDYLHAKYILKKYDTKDSVIEYCKKILLNISDNGEILQYGNEDVFAMLTSLFVIKYGEECINIIDDVKDSWDKDRIIDEYYRTFTWRSNNIKLNDFRGLLKKYPASPKTVWSVFIENSTKENCELNAIGLSQMLNAYDLNRRDYLWTIEINSLYEEDRIVSLIYYLEAGNSVEGLSDKKLELLLILMSWLLTSTNRTLRDRTSKAMVELLKCNFNLCLPLLEKFINVNDPYVMQRLFGIVFGAVMKRDISFEVEFEELAKWVVENVFAQEFVYPDILLRDYARLIVERFTVEFPEKASLIHCELINPPYKSIPIPKVDVIDYESKEYDSAGVYNLLYSMKFDIKVKGIGMYGDFGRYTFQAALSYFKDVDLANAYYYSLDFIFNELGYTTDLFGEYDSHSRSMSRYDSKKIERIGKKYQWIAMYNILARVSDTHKISDWGSPDIDYKGAWNPYVRDFDPTLNCRIASEPLINKIGLPEYNENEFIDINAGDDEIRAWTENDSRVFSEFPERLILTDAVGDEWVTLYHLQEYKKQPTKKSDIVLGFPQGEQHIWSISTAFFGPKTMENKDLLSQIKKEKSLFNFGRGIRNCYSLYSREYAWSSGYQDEFQSCEGEDEESRLSKFVPAAINLLWEEEYDASQDETTSFLLPAGEIIEYLQLAEKEYDGFYYFGDDLVAYDLKLTGVDGSELVIRKDYLCKFLEETNSALFWTVAGEKQYFKGERSQVWQRREGLFVFDGNEIIGEIGNVENK